MCTRLVCVAYGQSFPPFPTLAKRFTGTECHRTPIPITA